MFYIKTLKMLLRVSILRPSSRSTYCSLLKLHVKIVNTSSYLSVMWQRNLCLCMHCFQCREVCRLHTSPHWKQRLYKHIICCLITDKYNDIFTILTFRYNKEQYVLPEDGLRIETCRSILSVLIWILD